MPGSALHALRGATDLSSGLGVFVFEGFPCTDPSRCGEQACKGRRGQPSLSSGRRQRRYPFKSLGKLYLSCLQQVEGLSGLSRKWPGMSV